MDHIPTTPMPTPTTSVPAVVDDYFALLDSGDRVQTVRTFSADARVTDDGTTYRGHDEIRSWLSGAAGEYTYTSTRLSAETSGRAVGVVVHLVGDFPGGEVDLRHDFTLDAAGLIDGLTIAVRSI